MRIKRNKMTLRRLTPHSTLNTLYVLPPSLRNEFSTIRSPDIRVRVYAKRIPAYPRLFGDGYFASEGKLGGRDAVD